MGKEGWGWANPGPLCSKEFLCGYRDFSILLHCRISGVFGIKPDSGKDRRFHFYLMLYFFPSELTLIRES